jgi:hypothetical protein
MALSLITRSLPPMGTPVRSLQLLRVVASDELEALGIWNVESYGGMWGAGDPQVWCDSLRSPAQWAGLRGARGWYRDDAQLRLTSTPPSHAQHQLHQLRSGRHRDPPY